MNIAQLSLSGAFLITSAPIHDERGYFARSFCKTTFKRHGLETEFPQHSISFNLRKGTLRGLHYQASPHEEIKLIRCTRGAIFDVMVDLRDESPTYGQWLGFELSADNHMSLYIPARFAHGFISLKDATEVHYQISTEYEPGHGRTIRWNDPELAITWPMQPLVISQNDEKATTLHNLKYQDAK